MTKTTVKASNYDIITDSLVAMMESILKDGRKWESPFVARAGLLPSNKDNVPYSGVNSLILNLVISCIGYKNNRFMTFKQAKDLGANVKKGQKGYSLCYYNIAVKNEGTSDETRIPFLKRFVVFNVEQIENLPDEFYRVDAPAVVNNSNARYENIESAIMPYMQSLGGVDLDGDSAYYVPSSDKIVMPALQSFKNTESYYGTLFHELTHSTGASKRLNRDFNGRFGSSSYAFEELIAEIGASFLCNDFSICDYNLQENHACYLASWIKVLKSDSKAIFKAASEAKKAVKLINPVEIPEVA